MARLNTLSSSHHTIPEQEIIFSLMDDYVWASWPDSNATVRLGRHDMVAAMMQDFLAQDALGQRLAMRPSSDD